MRLAPVDILNSYNGKHMWNVFIFLSVYFKFLQTLTMSENNENETHVQIQSIFVKSRQKLQVWILHAHSELLMDYELQKNWRAIYNNKL